MSQVNDLSLARNKSVKVGTCKDGSEENLVPERLELKLNLKN